MKVLVINCGSSSLKYQLLNPQSGELLAKGLNDSVIHEDVMIGAPDTNVIGTTKDGKEVTIFTSGEWAF